jgi:hypothetical protein
MEYPGKSSEQSCLANRIPKFPLKSILLVSIMIRSDKADSNITWCNELKIAQFWLSSVMDRGIRIDFNDEQPESAPAPIRASFDPGSIISEESYVQLWKQYSPSNSTEAGRQIDFNDGQCESASVAIRASFDPDSNVNNESDLQ